LRHLIVPSLSAFLIAGAGGARAEDSAQEPRSRTTNAELRQIADHYRQLTWTYERAAGAHTTQSSLSYRAATGRSYLQWTIDLWQARAEHARARALAAVRKRVQVALPQEPPRRAPIVSRIVYQQAVTWRLQRVYPGRTTRASDSFRTTRSPDYRRWTLHLWQRRAAGAALAVAKHAPTRTAVSPSLTSAFMCIHRFEGPWNANTGNGFYGGLQMDWSFMRAHGGDFLARWGTADHWPAWAQIEAAARAYRSGRGFSPWPNTASACGLI
jgi:GH24 family phage-related lysozyme (muramidase)